MTGMSADGARARSFAPTSARRFAALRRAVPAAAAESLRRHAAPADGAPAPATWPRAASPRCAAGDLDEASQALERARALPQPSLDEQADTLFLAGEIALARRDADAAIAAFEGLLDLGPPPHDGYDVRVRLALAEIHRKRLRRRRGAPAARDRLRSHRASSRTRCSPSSTATSSARPIGSPSSRRRCGSIRRPTRVAKEVVLGRGAGRPSGARHRVRADRDLHRPGRRRSARGARPRPGRDRQDRRRRRRLRARARLPARRSACPAPELASSTTRSATGAAPPPTAPPPAVTAAGAARRSSGQRQREGRARARARCRRRSDRRGRRRSAAPAPAPARCPAPSSRRTDRRSCRGRAASIPAPESRDARPR